MYETAVSRNFDSCNRTFTIFQVQLTMNASQYLRRFQFSRLNKHFNFTEQKVTIKKEAICKYCITSCALNQMEVLLDRTNRSLIRNVLHYDMISVLRRKEFNSP